MFSNICSGTLIYSDVVRGMKNKFEDLLLGEKLFSRVPDRDITWKRRVVPQLKGIEFWHKNHSKNETVIQSAEAEYILENGHLQELIQMRKAEDDEENVKVLKRKIADSREDFSYIIQKLAILRGSRLDGGLTKEVTPETKVGFPEDLFPQFRINSSLPYHHKRGEVSSNTISYKNIGTFVEVFEKTILEHYKDIDAV